MQFISFVTGPPVPTTRPVRCGSYAALLTTNGFVVADPAAYGIPDLWEEAVRLPSGSGYIHGRLHLRSRHLPMYYPGSSPRLLLISPHLLIMPIHAAPAAMQQEFRKQVVGFQDIGEPDPEVLRNVLPCFDNFEDGGRLAAV